MQFADTIARQVPITLEGVPAAESWMRSDDKLYTGFGWLDSVIGGFKAPELVLVDCSSQFLGGLISEICVQATTAFGIEMAFVDGGNSIDPYDIARICKFRGQDPIEVLSRINVARGFTAYQLAAIINQQLEGIIHQSGVSTLVVSSFIDLFLDRDMRWAESFQLVKRSMRTLRRLTEEYGLVCIITNQGPGKFHRSGSLRRVMETAPDRIVRMEGREAGMLVTLPRTGTYLYRYPVARGQAVIDRYIREVNYGQDSRDLQAGP